MDRELTLKQKNFILEYLKDFNATQAGIRAGYSKETAYSQGQRLLKNVEVKKKISKEFERNGSVTQKILSEYFKIATADIKDFITVDEGGAITAKPFNEIPDGMTSVIKKVREKRIIKQTKDTKGDIILDDTIEYELFDKQKALDALAKIARLLNDNTEVNIKSEQIPQAVFQVYSKESKAWENVPNKKSEV